ncbi:acyltransferase [Flavobacterium zepuense]|uniref:Acyltransferase n=1 Tax=Flavobacterium zepuense TaxID=2593302 RepID=A0A552V2E2_9FLAO|nr:acyltransferase [Flavobacterium zepuense]TRW24627.1 acyltransferase [Flavobacterium zepuense]
MKANRSLLTRFLYRIVAINYKLAQKLRIAKLKALGATIGAYADIGKVLIQGAEQISIGAKCKIEDYVRLRVGGPWKQASIEIGTNTFIGHSTQINVGTNFKIGNDCMIAPLCVFSDANHGFEDLDIPMKAQPCRYDSITVMDDVWIGSGTVILGGVTIGKGVVVAAGAVVNKSIPDYEIWGGIPAKKIKSRKLA